MCGIYAYINFDETDAHDSTAICLKGLKYLEYRGYDSAGIGGLVDGKITSLKKAGKIQSLKEAIQEKNLRFHPIIAHTRWATHGMPNEKNAHPHFDQKRTLVLVHNGIIENHLAVKKELENQGIIFYSETDSEVIAQLIAYLYQNNLKRAVMQALKQLQGSLAIALIHVDYPKQIIAASRSSPLAIGISQHKREAFISSDINSFQGRHLDITYLEDDEICILNRGQLTLFNQKGSVINKQTHSIHLEHVSISKQGFKHFMMKEIFQQPETIKQAMDKRIVDEFGTTCFDELRLSNEYLQSINYIIIIGCGSAWHAGLIGALMLEEIARIPTETKIASEFRYTNPIISKHTLVIALSQSGETADTIAALREAKAKGATVIGICNVKNTALAREADSCIFLHAGPEISVCSTKAFTSLLTVLSLFALLMARLRHMNKEEGQNFLNQLKQIPDKVQAVLSQNQAIQHVAYKYAHFKEFYFLGRQYMYPTSLEAALKLKEISYLHASGYPAGEMKHGPLALVSPDLAIIGLCGNHQTREKMASNLMEVKARQGSILLFACEGMEELNKISEEVIRLPQTPDPLASIIYSVATQLFAYHIADYKGSDIDQPRNLAKSVTVE